MLTQNEDAFRALDYGADDFDLPIEDEVTQKAGAHIDLDLERLLEVPRRLGYRVEYRRAERPAALQRPASRLDERRATADPTPSRSDRPRRARGLRAPPGAATPSRLSLARRA